ncbi:putative ribonuclease H-like domain-containing protein [Tanacetum coccineum]
MSNITTTYLVPSTPNIRIHKDHSLDHVIGDVQSGVLTRRMKKTINEQGFISVVFKGKTHEDLYTCLFACLLSQEEPKKLKQVWTLVDLPLGKRAIGTKWVYKNKKDERGFVIRNKARIRAIRLFLAYCLFKDFVVYQMDVKSEFLYGKIKEEVYVYQPPGFEDPEFPKRVYKVEKAYYGLHQAPRAWYETLSTYLLDNGFQRGQIDKTLVIKRVKSYILLVEVYVDDIIFGSTKKKLCTEFEKLMHKKFQMSSMEVWFFNYEDSKYTMETLKPLLKDVEAEDVDVYLYRSMIGSLMYLTSSRPDIMFDVCACARFQVTPKVSHLYAVKRIFRYLKDRKSTTEGCRFLRSRLISWQCKKQTVVANSTTEAEYVATANSNEKKLIQMIKIHTYQNVADLLTKAFDVIRFQYLIQSNIPLVPTPDVSKPQKEPEQNPETSTEKVQNPKLENTAHVPSPGEEDSIFMEIPKPKAKKTVNLDPNPNSYPSKLPYPERMKVREHDKPSAQHSRFLKMFKQLRLEIGLKDALVEMPKFNK